MFHFTSTHCESVSRSIRVRVPLAAFAFFICMFAGMSVQAQTTEFVYQGQLQSSSAPATGSYDFEFLLFDALTGGSQIGSTLTRSSVAVANGIFSVKLDFGSNYPGANRFLEIHVIQTGGGAFTPLTPRQAVSSAPYSVKSLNADTATNATNAVNAGNATTAATATNALSLGGVAASGYLQTNGNGSGLTNLNAANVATGTLVNARLGQIPTANIADSAVTSQKIATGQVVKSLNTLTDNVTLAAGSNISITPTGNTLTIASTGGSGGGIQNQTTLQTGANFNIDGTGTANILNAQTQYNIGGNRMLSNPGSQNLFAGVGAGAVNTTGDNNSFFGTSAGLSNTRGQNNSFFGQSAGLSNTTGFSNVFVGVGAGYSNTTGPFNSFFGESAGAQNTTGLNNSFFGKNAGLFNLTGSQNSFFGRYTGLNNTDGVDNAFFGASAGQANISGSANSFFGVSAGFNNTVSGNSFFGRSAGFQNTTGIGNSFFGTQAGRDNSATNFNSFFGYQAGISNTGANNSFFGGFAGAVTTGDNNAFFGTSAGSSNVTGSANTLIGDFTDVGSGNLNHATAIGFGTTVTASNMVQIGRVALDTVAIGAFATPTAMTPVCINNQGVFTNCTASSLSYKENVQPFRQGLNLIQRLRPVTFNWKEGRAPDLGLIAEDVAAVEPLLATHNSKGEVEGVKYTQLNVVLINAVKEQQAQIRQQQRQIDEQRKQIRGLTKIVCARKSKKGICRQ